MKKFVIFAPLLALLTASCAAQTQTPPLLPSPSVRVPTSFSVPDQGFASLALYDKNGVLVRSLLYLLSFPGQQPVAVLNQKRAPGAAAREKFEFASPWRSFTFDRVVVLRDVKLASGPIKGGTFVEAAIPWKDLGIVPRNGLQLKADVGALFGDVGGNATIARH